MSDEYDNEKPYAGIARFEGNTSQAVKGEAGRVHRSSGENGSPRKPQRFGLMPPFRVSLKSRIDSLRGGITRSESLA